VSCVLAQSNDISQKTFTENNAADAFEPLHPARRCSLRDLTILRFWFLQRQLGRATPILSKFGRQGMLRKFLRDENGATAIEYSLIAGFIALAIIVAVGLTGERLVELFKSLLVLFGGV
jgi:pilus assembly protein Flp/PilA